MEQNRHKFVYALYSIIINNGISCMKFPCSILALCLLSSPTLADVWTFETPSGNIQCEVGQDFDVPTDIICRIIERQGATALPRPSGCGQDWGHAFSMQDSGPVKGLCESASYERGGFSKAEYGLTAEFGGIYCHSSQKGLRCMNSDGNGFFLSRKKQSVFGPAHE
ncbi:DUF6636 domain-containing protein [uncultured Cohaesibacter sp.]|uniref:DUF6636 domain-containing protein n=1 Tax=uncultured Cohaesibacter sp. TaxID=1002546 RepID=UPI0029C6BB0B|nr:DUF6636 domain-containing protein [uncultured Cohaesibacter sp.]